MGSHHLTCDEGPGRHLAVVGACGGQGPDGCGAEGRPVPRRCSIGPRGKGLEERREQSHVRGSRVCERKKLRGNWGQAVQAGTLYCPVQAGTLDGEECVGASLHTKVLGMCVGVHMHVCTEGGLSGTTRVRGRRVTGVG